MTTSNPFPTVTSRTYREVMGHFATGVTVILTEAEGQIHGMTANAITSVSLEPLLLLVCVQKHIRMAKLLKQAGHFSINILTESQADLSAYFANMWPVPEPPPFSFEPWDTCPRLAGTLASLACQVDRFLDGGDHWIVTGLVTGLYQTNSIQADPLLYYRGQYRRLAPQHSGS